MGSLVVMPKLGLTMTEGEIEKWHKKVGEEIKEGEILFDVTTDKLTNEIESKVSGVVRKILAEEGETVECLKAVAIIADADEDIYDLLKEANGDSAEEGVEIDNIKGKEEEKANTITKVKEGRVKISPAAKKLALENNLDFEIITGTGPEGRIVLEDVKKYIENNKVKVSPTAYKLAKDLNVDLKEINSERRIMKEDVLNFNNSSAVNEIVNNEVYSEEKIELSPMRKVISARMSESWNTSPTVTYDIKVDTSNLRKLRNDFKDICKITYTDLLIKIVSKVLLQFPLLNCSVAGNELIMRNYVNMGVAVALDQGLIVPVIKYANNKGLEEISKEVKELAGKAKNNELASDSIKGGTFTITNLGMFGIEYFSPIINQPEVAILGVNKITETPVVEDGEIVIKPLMNLSLTADHRAVDGAVAAQFLSTLKKYIEKPELLLL
ncbi:dihydrolipoamide acetyltransferase family protein [Clostridium pasteurianum]|uniref:dihydrolipoamide acetyltransferase family protein n=1 Tax=Clostridium pasteurianum TaxID=1501 RepID=UPI002260B974|nr:dihydrolipoamide acetyltransferase family protein [Clostridium pasteurianum]UZW16206.1 dihydrolipoamide acetyltransferase family protein [Clostridium pasteurianum]